MNEIPPLRPADEMPPVHNDRDLHERWRALMGELGFDDRILWVTFVLPDGMMVPKIVQVAKVPHYPADDDLDGVMRLCTHEVEWLGSDLAVAMLLSRPGTRSVTGSDRAWGRGTANAARAAGIRAYPLHVASDEAVRVLAPDDLIGAA